MSWGTADAADRLRALWLELFAGGHTLPSPESLGGAAESVGIAARRAGLLPEHLVIGVKESWMRHAAAQPLVGRVDAERVLAEVMSLCIREYFRELDPPFSDVRGGD